MKKAIAPPLTLGLGWKDTPNDHASSPAFVPRAEAVWRAAEEKAMAVREADRTQTLARLCQHYELAIQQLQSERQAVAEETHPELLFRSAGLKRRRAEIHQSAKKAYDAKEGHLRRLLESEEASIEEEYQSCIDKVKERVSVELDKRQKQVENQLQGVPDDERTNTRSLRSKASKDEEQEPELPIISGAPKAVSSTGAAVIASKRSRRPFSPTSMLLEKMLDEDEIKKDKWDIAREEHIIQHGAQTPKGGAVFQGRRRSSGSDKITVHARNGRLTCDDTTFAKGETVLIFVTEGPGAMSNSFGSIQSINNTEVHVKLQDGTKQRVYLSHLRNGRAVMKHHQG